ncbi:uncharacterized protein LOC103576693 [Microplitis demolitor]|uniref:uncharacterized protein LOC103576693 n=1 Tax=Microplitis demolitor TaxID=69319 RepID=UPI0004CCCB81|nr:uncharacterized protein LOC103576693 [Microplitis demolitor]XP_008555236.1 uncharacterized protein LOC103576693 [Microplitis demolitor]
MTKNITKAICVFLLILDILQAVTLVNHYPDDDYVVEHEVSYHEAIANARNLTISTGPIPGCKACTNEEMTYCKDGSVISDHCCCDSSYNKVIPFVEHTCRIGRQACKPIAENCADYERLRDCCCLSYLGSVWKYRAGGSVNVKPSLLITAGALSILHVCHKMYN